MLRILTFSTLYPNAAQPNHGIFVEERLRRLVETGEVETQVVAPIPWFPFAHSMFGRYARYASAPSTEERHGIRIDHPRYPVVPRVGMTLAPSLMIRALEPVLRDIRRSFPFDLIDAHYLYPDGVAAVTLGQRLGVPVVMTARGSDVSAIPHHRFPRRMILSAIANAAAIITVSNSLRIELSQLGADRDKITVLRNGVDLQKFRPLERESIRKELSLTGPTVLAVGALIPRKGHDIPIRALPSLPDVTLLIIGEGELRDELIALARRLRVSDRVRFLGPIPHAELARYYSAADVLALTSDNEGMANVLLESIACGTPLIATPISGNPEVVSSPNAGILMASRTPEAFRQAHVQLSSRYPRRELVRAHAETFGWDATTRGQLEIFRATSRTSGSQVKLDGSR